MALEPGTRLGPYEIVAPLGAGGMGVVYRARDTKLGRDVAVKVVLESLVEDADRAARFEREARALAALNHPNIATLHGMEEVGGQHFLVMELVEGDDLSLRIAQGAMPLVAALPIARQIAEALEAAHEAGIIHRDLKPANIKVKDDGTVKVLDFGLAKAMGPDTGPGAPDPANSPTLTARATQMGMILGTAAYMAPEQAKGKHVDKRADVWAFGVVLFEMLAGRRPFEGSDISEVMARVISHEPDWKLLPTDLPVALRRLLRRSLAKARTDRLPDIAAARLEIADLEAGVTDTDGVGESGVGVAAAPAIWQRPAFLASAGVLLIALTAVVAITFAPASTGPLDRVGVRFQHVLPEGQAPSGGRRAVALSSDGTQLIYATDDRLYLRDLGELNARAVAGTGPNLASPTFSPTGDSIAFYERVSGPGAIRRLPVGGGTSSLVAAAAAPEGMSWSPGFIVYGQADGIYRVPDIGGTPERLLTVDPSAGLRVGHPQLVNDGRSLLYTASNEVGDFARGSIHLREIASGEDVVLVPQGTSGRLVPTGHLVFHRDTAVFAAAIDLVTHKVGGPVPLIEGVSTAGWTSEGQFAVSDSGVVAFVPGGLAGDASSTLSWFDRTGRSTPLGVPTYDYTYPRISPDGRRIAIGAGGGGDMFVWDIERSNNVRITSEGGADSYPVWSADSRHVYFGRGAGRPGESRLHRQAADGSGEPALIWEGVDARPQSLSPEGLLVFGRYGDGRQLFFRPLAGGDPRPVVADPTVNALNGELSPDGRWIAYESSESGAAEIFVRPFPAVDTGRWQVSSGGGRMPAWSRTGRELFYVRPAEKDPVLSAVDVPVIAPNADFDFGTPRSLFVYPAWTGRVGRLFDVSPDGKRFVIVVPGQTAAARRGAITIITDWFTDVRKVK